MFKRTSPARARLSFADQTGGGPCRGREKFVLKTIKQAAANMAPVPLSLSQLESHLWEAANILRGSPVDRTDWKSYILPSKTTTSGKPP